MREIKYRAWDKEHKKMRGVMEIKWFNNGNIRVNATEDDNNYEPLLYMKNYNCKELKEFELMQYTGIKDINGVEIYEGDIVKFTERNYENCSREKLISEETSIQIVTFNYQAFGLKASKYDKGLRPFIWALSFDHDIEVIGNIYKNPELINQKDIKLYMNKENYEIYKRGEVAFGIKANNYHGLIKQYGDEMKDLNILVKVRVEEILRPVKEIDNKPVVNGWYEVYRRR